MRKWANHDYTSIHSNPFGSLEEMIAAALRSSQLTEPEVVVTYDAPYDERCYYCREQYCHPDSSHEAEIAMAIRLAAQPAELEGER